MTGQQPDPGAGPDAKPPVDGTNNAFLVLGLVFFVLGLSGIASGETSRIVFLPVGIVFFAVSVARSREARQDREAGSGSDGGPAAAHGDDAHGASSGGDAGGGGE
ncbi:hypothetical protein [Cellulomonas xiejunii]|uniref:Uncharacterized protein n=1 Tax=Cellulomonas xiejunii TaxID=2968083 RepID=A0ABY5KQ03_9CELL|nr:hypothetical protein [Cellulomonas xiejunii]MCC2313549.1 hypothetical protein [Cellulomonas xiejunii]MCC2321277.1 hypothetical protein [Cellulomonas xiejunii]UUI71865.1 hypothetical protein NP048_19095 [Cellulomonas xiejunii]